jgi:hypothetical protein
MGVSDRLANLGIVDVEAPSHAYRYSPAGNIERYTEFSEKDWRQEIESLTEPTRLIPLGTEERQIRYNKLGQLESNGRAWSTRYNGLG